MTMSTFMVYGDKLDVRTTNVKIALRVYWTWVVFHFV